MLGPPAPQYGRSHWIEPGAAHRRYGSPDTEATHAYPSVVERRPGVGRRRLRRRPGHAVLSALDGPGTLGAYTSQLQVARLGSANMAAGSSVVPAWAPPARPTGAPPSASAAKASSRRVT